MEDSVCEHDLMNCGYQEVSEEKNVSMWPRDWSCGILVKKYGRSGPFSKGLPEAKVKRSGLIPLAEGISKHPSVDSVIWLLLFMLVKIYIKQRKPSKEKYQM